MTFGTAQDKEQGAVRKLTSFIRTSVTRETLARALAIRVTVPPSPHRLSSSKLALVSPARHDRTSVPGWRAGRQALAALAVVLAVACTPIYSNHGFVPDDQDLAGIATGVDTRDTVGAFLGRPSVEGLLGDTEWFYVQSRWKAVGGREPQEIDRQVLAISFDPNGTVSNIERFGLDKGRVVAISRRVTTEPIKGRSALSQIFSTFGRIDPASLIGKQ